MTRNGKIARLPRVVRERLNQKIENGEPGTELVEWLNGEPLAQQVLQKQFNSRPISEQNLSEWKNGGYVEWLARQEIFAQARELSDDAWALGEDTDSRLTDRLATALAARYAAVLATWNGQVTDEIEKTLRVLRALCQDIALLRRGEHNSARIKMEEQKLDLKMEKERKPSFSELMGGAMDWMQRKEIKNARPGNETVGKPGSSGAETVVPPLGSHAEEIQANQTESNQSAEGIMSSELKTKNAGPGNESPVKPAKSRGESAQPRSGSQSEEIRVNQTGSK